MQYLIILILFSSTAIAEVSGEVGAYSNFIWRGTTFSNNKPAVQIELYAEEEHGFFLSTFASNAEFSDEAMGANSQVTQEVDFLIGKRWQGKSWEVSASYNYFAFPGAEVFNTDELFIQGAWRSYKIELSYMNDYFGYESIYKYIRLGKEWSFRDSILTNLYVGYNSFTTPKGTLRTRCLDSSCFKIAETLTGAGNPDYIDVFLVNKKVLENGITVELAFNWTNRKEYSVENGETSVENAKDFATVVAVIFPFSI